MPASADRILITQVGSLVRPRRLVQYFEAQEDNVAVDAGEGNNKRARAKGNDARRRNRRRGAGGA